MSVVIAAHDEAATIGDVVRAAQVAAAPVEVIVVDDGSTDDTSACAAAAGAKVLRLVPNRGKGVALRTGIAASCGDWLVFLDADGQDDPAEIPRLLEAIDEDVGMVNGSRFIGRLHPGAISLPNWVGNLVMTGLLNLVFLRGVTDSQAGFRAIRGDLARSFTLTSRQYEIETEMLAKVLKGGHRVVEVPVNRYRRQAGSTDFRRIQNGLRILRRILEERFA